VKYLPLGRAGALVRQLAAFVRRQRDARKPRVRIRLAHGETRVLDEGDAGRERLLSLAAELVEDYGGPSRARP
jgi:hypothetical protein